MPNYVTNKLAFNGDKKDIENLLDNIFSKDNETIRVDFNKIIPMPKSFEDLVSGSITDQALAVYYAKERKEYSRIDKILKYPCYQEKYNTRDELIKYLEEQGATVELGAKYVYNIETYGCPTWYEWCNRNWGTKWNAMETYYDPKTHNISFETAWSPVIELFLSVSEKNPNVEIFYKFADEDFGYNVGALTIKNGVIIDENFPDGGSNEAKALAEEILGYNFDED